MFELFSFKKKIEYYDVNIQTQCFSWGLRIKHYFFFSILLIIFKVYMEPYCLTMKHHLINTNCLPDGVQEVAYIHSNQTVIGSSKAENHMSRWAARDVFELKQFSQLPANVAVCTSKVREHRVLTSLVFRSYSIGSSLNTSSKKVAT